jgi:tetratricopeptide (TPR) repeat protein
MIEEDATNTRWRRDLAVNQGLLGRVLQAQGELDDAHEMYRARMETIKDLAAQSPTDNLWQIDLVKTWLGLSELLLIIGNLDDVSEYIESSFAILRPLVEKNPEDRQAVRLAAANYTLLGRLHMRRGAIEKASAAWSQAVELIEPVAQASEDSTILDAWARPLLYLDRTEEARPIVERLKEAKYRDRGFVALCKAKGFVVEYPDQKKGET